MRQNRSVKLDKISIQTAGLAFGGPGLCSYRVKGVDGSHAKHLTVESYATVMLPAFLLIIIIFLFFIYYNRQRTRRSLTCHTSVSQCLHKKNQ